MMKMNKQKKTVPITIPMSDEGMHLVRAAARVAGLTTDQWINRALEDHCAKLQSEEIKRLETRLGEIEDAGQRYRRPTSGDPLHDKSCEAWDDLTMVSIAAVGKMSAVAVITNYIEQNAGPGPQSSEVRALIQLGDELEELAPKLQDAVYAAQPMITYRASPSPCP